MVSNRRLWPLLAMAFALIFPGDMFGACPEFTVSTGPAVGTPYGIASADFNEDGKLDLAVPNFTTSSVSILIGQGDGSFATAVNYTTGANPISVAVGDVNRDGTVDVLTANFGASSFSVLLNNGNGTFAPKVDYATGSAPWAIVVTELDGMGGSLDVVLAEYAGTPVPPATGNTISVSRGVGNGTFGTRATYAVGYAPSDVAAGDFNRDGRPDLAVSHENDSSVAVLLANSGGSFDAATMINVGGRTDGIAAVDVDGGSGTDLIVTKPNSSQVGVLISDGSGGFAAPVTYTVGVAPRNVAAADVNGDGDHDLIVSNFGGNTVSLLLGGFLGTFQSASTINVGGGPTAVAGDFNRDGRVDLATANNAGNNTSIALASASCARSCNTFGVVPTSILYDHTSPVAVVTADLDRNGWMDMVIGSSTSNQIKVAMFYETLSASTTFDVGRPQNDVAVGDINGDGWPDLVFVSYLSSTLSVKFGSGNGFTVGIQEFTTGLNYPTDVATGDFNRDGLTDVAVVNEQGPNPVSVFMAYTPYLNIPPHLLNPTYFSAGAAPAAIAVADIDGSGTLDLAVANKGSNNVTVLLGNGTGGFGSSTSTAAAGAEPADIALGDIDRDGIVDIVTTHKSAASISIYRWTPSSVFDTRVDVAAGGVPVALTVGDYNVDGRLDISAALTASNQVAMFLGNGTTTPAAAQLLTSTGGPSAIATGDLDRDGRPEVMAASPTDNTVRAVESLCATTTTITTSQMNVRFGIDQVTFTVNVASPGLQPSGSAQIRNGVNGPLLGTATITNGIGTFSTSSLAIGAHTIVATFAPTTNYAASSGNVSQTVRLGEPYNIVVTPNNATDSIDLSWQAIPGATSYRVYRRQPPSAAVTLIASPTSAFHADPVPGNTLYIYYLTAVAGATESNQSLRAAAMIVDFTDPTVTGGSTIIQAVHVTELRSAVNVWRVAAGLTAFSFAETPPVVVKAVHFQELRNALDAAYGSLGFPNIALTFTDSTLTIGSTVVKAVHVEELRTKATRSVEIILD